MTGALPAESQFQVYCCGYTYTFRLSGKTGALPAESQLLVYCCGYTSTFRLSEAWQENYLLSHNFWYTVVDIPIYSGCQKHDRSITCWVTISSVLLWLYLYIQAVRQDRSINCWVTTSGVLLWLYLYIQAAMHDRSITCWVTTSGVLLWLYLYIQADRHDRSITCWVTTCGILLWLYLYIQVVRGMTGALPAESQLLVYCCGYTYTFRLSEAWQKHYLLSHNFWCSVVAIPIQSGFQAWQEHYLLSHMFWNTVGFSGYTYTFRLSEAWQ